MRAAIYLSRHPGPSYDEEVAYAKAYCERHALTAVRVYHADFLRDRRKLDGFYEEAKSGCFEVVLAPFPDAFPSRVIMKLVGMRVGFACYAPGFDR